MDKRHLYKTAWVVGLNHCCVAILRWNEEQDTYLCLMPFGNEMWKRSEELERFCL